jgi:hypothetical protein
VQDSVEVSAQFLAELLKDRLAGHQIEMAAAGILEERDVIRSAPADDRSARKIVEVAEHIGFLDGPARDRLQNVADAAECGFPPIDEHTGSPGRCIIRFARLRRISADEIEMNAGPQIGTLDQRLMRTGAGRNKVRRTGPGRVARTAFLARQSAIATPKPLEQSRMRFWPDCTFTVLALSRSARPENHAGAAVP